MLRRSSQAESIIFAGHRRLCGHSRAAVLGVPSIRTRAHRAARVVHRTSRWNVMPLAGSIAQVPYMRAPHPANLILDRILNTARPEAPPLDCKVLSDGRRPLHGHLPRPRPKVSADARCPTSPFLPPPPLTSVRTPGTDPRREPPHPRLGDARRSRSAPRLEIYSRRLCLYRWRQPGRCWEFAPRICPVAVIILANPIIFGGDTLIRLNDGSR